MKFCSALAGSHCCTPFLHVHMSSNTSACDALAGDIEREMDPYFPFEEAVDVWARTFAALGIQYRGARMRLDLCDRPGKYSNGFCHWPQPAWRRVSHPFFLLLLSPFQQPLRCGATWPAL